MTKIEEIREAVLEGEVKSIGELVEEALADGCTPGEILKDGMIYAMNEIGGQFSNNEVYVPELLMAAHAMKMGVEVLKPLLTDDNAAKAGKAIIGTVEGDLHDIGKNLVIIMLESSGFEVIDLGVDVPAKGFVDAIREHTDARIVGISALLTTTMEKMEKTVEVIRELGEASRLKIMVGGAPVTQKFADKIKADAYTEDAASAAKKAKELIMD